MLYVDGIGWMDGIGYHRSKGTFGANKAIDLDSVDDDNQPWTSHREQG